MTQQAKSRKVVEKVLTDETLEALCDRNILFVTVSDIGSMGHSAHAEVWELTDDELIIWGGYYYYSEPTITYANIESFLNKKQCDSDNFKWFYTGFGNHLYVTSELAEPFSFLQFNFLNCHIKPHQMYALYPIVAYQYANIPSPKWFQDNLKELNKHKHFDKTIEELLTIALAPVLAKA